VLKGSCVMKAFRSTVAAVLLLATGPLASAADAAPALAELIQSGNRAAALEQIRAGGDVGLAQPDGTTPLQWATYRVDVELVRALIAKGARAA
jgi:ankyrin repeat protein